MGPLNDRLEALHFVDLERLRLGQQRGVRRDLDVVLHADVVEQRAARLIAHGDDRGARHGVTHMVAQARIDPTARLIGLSVQEPGPAAPDLDVEFYHRLLANAADFMTGGLGA